MIEVGTKDRIFVAVVLPAALVAAYLYGWRDDAARNLASLEGEHAALVQEHEFRRRRSHLAMQRQISMAELEEEKAVPPPPARVRTAPGARQAEREDAVFQIFREAGVRILGVEAAESPNASVGAILRNAGASDPIACRVFSLEGDYGAVVSALKTISAKELAVLPETLELRVGGRNHWTMVIWL